MIQRVAFFSIALVIPAFLLAESTQAQPPLFQRFDRNNDGKLTESELPERARQIFNRIDKNRDGVISPQEFEDGRPQQARNGAPEGYRVVKNLAYVEEGHRRHVLDLYLPEEKEQSKESARPALVVYIHGGGWQNGSKDNSRNLVPIMKEGFACAAINYRLSSHAIFPAQIHDCKAAIRWLRAHADEYGYDGDRIGIWGSSAGGHLVALLGTSGDVEELEGDLGVTGVSSRVQAVCDYFGPTDLTRMDDGPAESRSFNHNSPNSPEAKLLGGPIQERKELAQKANPINYVSSDDPPFYIVHGDKDRTVPLSQSEMLNEALEKAKVPTNLKVIKGAGHGRFNNPKVEESVVEFFKKTLE